MRYAFADCLLATQLYTLSRAGLAIPLRPKAFQVLRYLLAHRSHLVSKEELCAHVWPAQFISDATIEGCIKRARQAMGDTGRTQQLMQTRRGYGYRFVGAVEERPAAPPAQAPTVMLRLWPATPPQDDTPWRPDSAQLPGEDSIASSPGAVSLAPRSALAPRTAPVSTVQGVPGGERKLVTLLGCTLAQATVLQARVGLDALHRQMRTLYTLAQQEVHHYGGTLHHVAGTRLLALFGAPVAQEDHARRALLAAWELHQRLAAAQSGDAAAEPLPACLGLHTGLMALGGIGDTQGAAAVVGDLPLTVEALQEHAAPGMLLCSEATARLVQRDVRLEEVAPGPVPGQPSPVRTYQVLGLHAQDIAGAQAERRARSPFVGRAPELATLHAVLAQVVGGRGQAVGIVGEPGMGKSRLLAEWRQQLPAHGVAYLEGRCLSYSSTTPYLPVLDWLRVHCGITPADGAAAITAKVCESLQAVGLAPDTAAPSLLHLLGVEAATVQVAGSSSDTLKAHTFATLRQLWLTSSQQPPLILAVEDLHWSDPTSEEFLAALVEGLPGAALLALGTYRPGYRPVGLAKSYATQLTVPPLSAQDSVPVVQAVLQRETVPPPLAEVLLAKAQGTPFFLEELAQTLAEQDAGQGGPTGQAPRPRPALPDLQRPPTVQAVLAARIARLAPEAQRLLQTAAVVGMDVPVPLLQAITELPAVALQQGLAHLQATEFLYETHRFPEPASTFKHALTQEVAYGSLLQARRRGLHARSVEALEALAPERVAEQVERLAHHAVRGEVWDKAVTYGQQAGVTAHDRAACREAVAAFEQALQALTPLPEDDATRVLAIDLRLVLVGVLGTLGEHGRRLALLGEAEALARACDDRTRLGQVYRMTGDHEGAMAVGRRALALAAVLGDSALQVQASYFLGQAYAIIGDFVRAAELLRWSVEAADKASDQPSTERIGSQARLARLLGALGAFAEGRRHGEEALRLATWAGRGLTPIMAHGCLGHLSLTPGDLERAIRVLEQGLARCHASGAQTWLQTIAGSLGFAYGLQGRLTAGRVLLEEGSSDSLRTGDLQGQACRVAWLSEVCRLAGRGEEAGQHARQALDLARQQQARGDEALAWYQLGVVQAYADPPNATQAEAHYQQARALAEALGMRPLQAHCHHGLGTLYAKTGPQKQARAALSTAMAMYHSMDMTFWLPQAEATLAQVSVC
jgi:DNA-binding winged helix-turn-helix (wHTH) protein/class 3 adenylate cyclase/tetratricopeptide (TPR) repeat protein